MPDEETKWLDKRMKDGDRRRRVKERIRRREFDKGGSGIENCGKKSAEWLVDDASPLRAGGGGERHRWKGKKEREKEKNRASERLGWAYNNQYL